MVARHYHVIKSHANIFMYRESAPHDGKLCETVFMYRESAPHDMKLCETVFMYREKYLS